MATLYRADGTQEEVSPRNPREGFTLEELYRMLDCSLVEVAYPQEGYSDPTFLKPKNQIMIVDEEFLYNKEPFFNAVASKLYGYSPVHGAALVCNLREFK